MSGLLIDSRPFAEPAGWTAERLASPYYSQCASGCTVVARYVRPPEGGPFCLLVDPGSSGEVHEYFPGAYRYVPRGEGAALVDSQGEVLAEVSRAVKDSEEGWDALVSFSDRGRENLTLTAALLTLGYAEPGLFG